MNAFVYFGYCIYFEYMVLLRSTERRTPLPSILEQEATAPAESERPALDKIENVLKAALKARERHIPKLVGPHGEEIELPESVFNVLSKLVHHMAHGRAVMVVPVNKELTTQEAADILNVSRPFLVKLLEQDEIPFTKIGTHRRIRFIDLMAYKKRRDTERRQGLSRLTQMSQEMGLYDD
jgi:excisionase family DNA binding protein